MGLIIRFTVSPLLFVLSIFLPLGILIIYYELKHIQKTKELQEELKKIQ